MAIGGMKTVIKQRPFRYTCDIKQNTYHNDREKYKKIIIFNNYVCMIKINAY